MFLCMVFTLPSEIIVKTFLPTFRGMVTRKLNQRGLTQQEIADKLGITQAAVSKYISDSGNIDKRFKENQLMKAKTEEIAEELISQEIDEYKILSEILELIHVLEDRGLICEIHEERMPSIKGLGCDLCIRGKNKDLLIEQDVLSNVRKASRKLANNTKVVEYIPNVGTNIGMSLPEPTDETDIAAIPGRLYVLRGQVNIPSNPEFGVSKHVSQAILAANKVDNTIRGGLNIKTDDFILEKAKNLGIDTMEFDPTYENRYKKLKKLFSKNNEVPKIIYHEGEFGIEPITYILEETAIKTVSVFLEILEN